MVYLTLGAYSIASLLYLVFVVGAQVAEKRARIETLARAALGGAFLAHGSDIGIHCAAGHHPLESPAEVMSLVAWLLVAGYLGLTFRYRIAVVGAFVAPVALMLLFLARLSRAQGIALDSLGVLGRVHISLATCGVAAFGLAAGVALLYLLQESQLKRRRPGALPARGPALSTLDTINRWCVTLGFPIFTLALVTGAAWVARMGDGMVLRPQYSFALATWIAFGALVLARLLAGWQGRRAAWLTLVGFASAVIVLTLYLFPRTVG